MDLERFSKFRFTKDLLLVFRKKLLLVDGCTSKGVHATLYHSPTSRIPDVHLARRSPGLELHLPVLRLETGVVEAALGRFNKALEEVGKKHPAHLTISRFHRRYRRVLPLARIIEPLRNLGIDADGFMDTVFKRDGKEIGLNWEALEGKRVRAVVRTLMGIAREATRQILPAASVLVVEEPLIACTNNRFALVVPGDDGRIQVFDLTQMTIDVLRALQPALEHPVVKEIGRRFRAGSVQILRAKTQADLAAIEPLVLRRELFQPDDDPLPEP